MQHVSLTKQHNVTDELIVQMCAVKIVFFCFFLSEMCCKRNQKKNTGKKHKTIILRLLVTIENNIEGK